MDGGGFDDAHQRVRHRGDPPGSPAGPGDRGGDPGSGPDGTGRGDPGGTGQPARPPAGLSIRIGPDGTVTCHSSAHGARARRGAAGTAWAAGERAGVAGAAGARPTVVWPWQLALFLRCPRRYDLEVRRRVRGAVFVRSAALAEGIALHEALRRWFRQSAVRRAAFPIEPTTDATADDGTLGGVAGDLIARWLDEALSDEPYLSAAGRGHALETLAGHAGWCLRELPAGGEVLLAERQVQSAPLGLGPSGPPVRYQARLDLVVRHPDGGVEHVDYKSGSPHPEHWVQRAVERLLVGGRHPVPPGGVATRTTTLYAAARQVETERHTPETLAATRADLRALTIRMLSGRDTAPAPAGHCHSCPHRAACPAHPA